MRQIEQPEDYGVTPNFRQMPNGELRLGLQAEDGSSYTRTVNTVSAWQNSHYHERYQELYIVQHGKIVLATLTDHQPVLKTYNAGEYFIVAKKVAHNIFQFADAVTHNVKFGDSQPSDWHAVEKLDDLVKHLTAEELNKWN
jgi:mannose-6-phosphate isomerase-like protein (cupin superfamily)